MHRSPRSFIVSSVLLWDGLKHGHTIVPYWNAPNLEMSGVLVPNTTTPDFASLHPGYLLSSCAVITIWPERIRAMPRGVTWSNRMSIDRRTSRSRGCVHRETPGGEFKNRVDLLPRQVELLNDLVDAGTGFQVVEDGGHGHSGIAKHPCATQSTRHTFNCGTSRPIECSHAVVPCPSTNWLDISPQRPGGGTRPKMLDSARRAQCAALSAPTGCA